MPMNGTHNTRIMKTNKKILLYDIETSYTEGAVWGLYEQNVVAVLEEPFMISFSWKWLGESQTHVLALPDMGNYKKNKKSDKELVGQLWALFDEADIIIAHNGNSFDQKWTYARFVVNGYKPPSPAKYIDTKLVAKSKFRFNSNSLNSLGKYFGCGQKLDTGGIDLWIDCIKHDIPSAWNLMCKYNKQDVVLLEQVYLKMLPFMTNHPNMNVVNDTRGACSNCGGTHLQKRGKQGTYPNRMYQRLQCMGCGAWNRGDIVKA